MSSAKEGYLELIALTQLYLLQEYSRKEWITSNAEDFAYFRQQAKSKQSLPQLQKQIIQNAIESAPKTQLPTPAKLSLPAKEIIEPNKSTPLNLDKQKSSPALKSAEETTPQIPIVQTNFDLSPMKLIDEMDLNDIRRFFSEKFPNQIILEKIPDDSEAKKIQNAWKQQKTNPHAVILLFNEGVTSQAFLSNVCNAIQLHLAPAQMILANKIEQQNGWEALLQTSEIRLVIANMHSLQAMPHLSKHYRELPKDEKRLGKIPLLLLPDISSYFSEPKLKASLWRSLCNILKV
jgi:hypothetical protein